MNRYTRGPWKCYPRPDKGLILINGPRDWNSGGIPLIAEVIYNREANAPLIAAAPQLLKACRLALPLLEESLAPDDTGGPAKELTEAYCALMDAILQATGRTSALELDEENTPPPVEFADPFEE